MRERELAEAFGARGVDGLVIVPCATDQSYLRRDHQAGTALVFVDRPPRFMPGDAVVSDNAGGAREAVEHLIAAGPPPDRVPRRPRCPSSPPPSAARGYHEALDGAGIAAAPELERTDLADSDARRARRRASCCAASDPPTALFTGQNLITIGAIRALRAARPPARHRARRLRRRRARRPRPARRHRRRAGSRTRSAATPASCCSRGSAGWTPNRARGRRPDAADRARLGRDPARLTAQLTGSPLARPLRSRR